MCAQCGTAELFIDDTKINENGHIHGTVEIRLPHQPDCFLWNKARLTLKYMIAIRKHFDGNHFDETEWKLCHLYVYLKTFRQFFSSRRDIFRKNYAVITRVIIIINFNDFC